MARAVSSERKCPVGVSIDRAVSFALIVSAVNAKWPSELHRGFARIEAKYALVCEPGEISTWKMRLEINCADPAFWDPAEC